VRHVDLELLLLVAQGVFKPRVLSRTMYDHLRDLCSECRTAFDTFGEADRRLFEEARPGIGEEPFTADVRYAPAFGRRGERAFEWAQALARERRRAQEDVAILLALPAAERERRIVRARNRFRSRAVAELLIEESRRMVRASWKEARGLAALVPVVLSRIPGAGRRDWSHEIRLRALAHQANAHRAGGDFKRADRLFVTVRRELTESETTDAALHAEIASLEASLRLGQRRLDEARQLLDRAILLAREIDESDLLVRTLVKRGSVLWHQGRFEDASRDQQEALALLDADTDSMLYACAVGNLALCLSELGRYDDAAAVIELNRDRLIGVSGEWSRLRLLWLEGRIAHGRRRMTDAERLLLEARNGFIAEGKGFDVALVSLDLSLVYLDEARHSDLKRLARLMQPLFEASDLHSHATAALALYQKAALAERVSAELIRGLRAYLEAARNDPGLRFQAPA
jgi:tetratricopeptide (TPR) repeat protein